MHEVDGEKATLHTIVRNLIPVSQIGGNRAQNLSSNNGELEPKRAAATWGTDVGIRTIVRIVGCLEGGGKSRHTVYFTVTSREIDQRNAVVSSCKEERASFHGADLLSIVVRSGILDKVVDGRGDHLVSGMPFGLRTVGSIGSLRVISPAILAQHRAVVHAMFDRLGDIAASGVEVRAAFLPE